MIGSACRSSSVSRSNAPSGCCVVSPCVCSFARRGSSTATQAPLLEAQVAAIELVGGRVCEMILFPDHEPLKTAHDLNEAIAFAGVACASRGAVAAVVAYAEAEAAALIRENLDIVRALIDAMVRGVLDGAEVDIVIVEAVAARTAEAERQRRVDWRKRKANALRFIAEKARAPLN
jgi:hypothetical protein